MKGFNKILTYLLVFTLILAVGFSLSFGVLADDNQLISIMHITTTPGEDTSKEISINYHSLKEGSYVEYTFASDTKFTNATKVNPTEELWSTKGLKNTREESTFYTTERYVCTVRLTGLEARTKYIYRVVSGDFVSKTHSFSTSGLTNTWNFAAYTDFQYRKNVITHQLIKQMKEIGNNPALMLCSGDMVDVSANEYEWDYILDNDEFNDFVFAAASGDHEYWANEINGKYPQYDLPYTYNKLFANPQNGCETSQNSSYYFYYNNVLFVALDMNNSDTSSGKRFQEQVTWFKNTLDSLAGTYQYIVVFEHKSIFGSAKEDSQVAAAIRPLWYPVFKTYNVDLVLSGHDHMYSRTYQLNGNTKTTNSKYGTYYLDMGSSGDKRRVPDSTISEKDGIHEKVLDLNSLGVSCAANIEVNEQNMTVTVYDNNKKVVDSFVIKSKRNAPTVDCSAFDKDQFASDVSIKMTETYNNAGVLNFNDSLEAKYIKSIEVKNNNYTCYEGTYDVNKTSSFQLKNLNKLDCVVTVKLLDGTSYSFNKKIDFAVDKEVKIDYVPFKLYFQRALTASLIKDNSLTYKMYVDGEVAKSGSFSEDYIEIDNKYYEGDHNVRLEFYSGEELVSTCNAEIIGLGELVIEEESVELKINSMALISIDFKYQSLIECESDLIEFNNEGSSIKGIKAGTGVATFRVKGTNITKTVNVTVVDNSKKADSGCNNKAFIGDWIGIIAAACFFLLKKKKFVIK